MHTLTWNHTRKGTPMVFRGNWAQAWLTMARVRAVYPQHLFQLDGKPV